MYCNNCGHRNPVGANFCSSCGAVLATGDEETTVSLAADEGSGESGEVELSVTVSELPQGTGMLVVKRGPNAGSKFIVEDGVTRVGRHPESDIFLDDVTVSRRHAEFYRHPRGFTVRDVGSLNGTYVNRERIEEADLSDGDEVQVGKFRLMFLAGRRSHADRGGGAQVGA
ncbi:MAG: FHA domain-containing protein [Thermoplasmata archaeon]